jgi:hypothetical protein
MKDHRRSRCWIGYARADRHAASSGCYSKDLIIDCGARSASSCSDNGHRDLLRTVRMMLGEFVTAVLFVRLMFMTFPRT